LIGVARYLYAAFAWLFLMGVVVQVFFIGLALFAGRQNLDLHVSLGWILHLAPILVLAVAALARAGRPRILMAAALVVVVLIVPILALLRESSPVIAALHPVGATLAFWRGVRGARQALDRLRVAQPTTTVA
jgi:hypothetical protein